MRAVDIHVVGENTIGFLSQIAMFRRSVRRLYGNSELVKVRCFLGGDSFDWDNVPPYFREHLTDVDIIMADVEDYANRGLYAQCDLAFLDVREEAEVVVFADADTLWLRRIDDLLERVVIERAAAGVIAHYAPPGSDPDQMLYWKNLFEKFVGKEPLFDHKYLLDPSGRTPFYVNFAFVAVSAPHVRMYGSELVAIADKIRITDTYPYFSYQISFAIWISAFSIKAISLPVVFNFPNDDNIWSYFQDLEEEIFVIHYLRERNFRRGELFISKESFSEFLDAPKGRADTLLANILCSMLADDSRMLPLSSRKVVSHL